MDGSIFRFKHFQVRNERSAMKVNTDGVLLGAAVGLEGLATSADDGIRVLDAGTGTGTIALMIAQRLKALGKECHILGIDIDAVSAEEAAANFAESPWPEALSCRHLPLDKCEGEFELIVSNPPYYDPTLQNPDERKNTARHCSDRGNEGPGMSFRDLVDFASGHLSNGGRLALILPSDREKDLLEYADANGLAPCRLLRIRTVERKAPSRIVAEFMKESSPDKKSGLPYKSESLTIRENGDFSREYALLMRDFYLWG